jgi:atypical dual specificity phosphatase
MDWITDHIAIGNFVDAQSDRLPDQVEAVLCLREGCSCEARTDVDALHIPLLDGPGNSREDVAEAIRFIDEVVTAGDRILVHCHAGRSRSVIVVAKYLMRVRGMTSASALTLIESKREVYLSPGIEELLKTW